LIALNLLLPKIGLVLRKESPQLVETMGKLLKNFYSKYIAQLVIVTDFYLYYN
jgi:hypothetical protein